MTLAILIIVIAIFVAQICFVFAEIKSGKVLAAVLIDLQKRIQLVEDEVFKIRPAITDMKAEMEYTFSKLPYKQRNSKKIKELEEKIKEMVMKQYT